MCVKYVSLILYSLKRAPMVRKCLTCIFLPAVLFFLPWRVAAQAPGSWSSADIHHAIQKLSFLGSALYVAAHPDDENTRLISYLSNEVKAETAYLSMTRGDGGQNLIGPEIAEMLGVIRTQELLAARRIDGGNQMFSRAVDFGFSKHPDETLDVWGEEEALSDVVWAIRRWQPDIIVNRFWHEYEERLAGRMHGHHTASGMLSYEAFDLAARPDIFPEQFVYVEPWQPRRLYFNSYTWFRDSRQVDSSKLAFVDVGVYYPLLGQSNNEIAARSRSMHKCQGFGGPLSRGTEMEELLLLKGDKPGEPADLFEGINTTWTRVKGGGAIGKLLGEVELAFDHAHPSASVPQLVQAYRMMERLPDGYWKRVKMAETQRVIEACLALFLEAAAEDYAAVPGDSVKLIIEAINRSPASVLLQSVTFIPQDADTVLDVILDNNRRQRFEHRLLLPEGSSYTSPYWLREPHGLGMYAVGEQSLRGLPETQRALRVRFNLLIEGEPMEFTKGVVYKETDPVAGEVYRPFELTPPVYVNIAEKVYIFGDERPRQVEVMVKAARSGVEGMVRLTAPEGWRVEPGAVRVSLPSRGQEQLVAFEVFPPTAQSEGPLHATVEMGGKTFDRELTVIDYAHIPAQMVLQHSESKVVKVDLRKAGERVAYIMGAGDEIPASLEQIGFDVDVLESGEVSAAGLKKYDAVILGIRAYNTVEWLPFKQAELFDYVKNGGTMIVQYNTASRLVVPDENLAPYRLELSRNRVTVEQATMNFLQPDHAVLNFPNEITQGDFDGWVQERGLYFPGEWDRDHFTPIFSVQDPGEEASEGSLLVGKYGDGYYIYTGLSFFRELPAGVPGAFRLFANLISIGKQDRP